MMKLITVLALVALIAACSSTPDKEQKAAAVEERSHGAKPADKPAATGAEATPLKPGAVGGNPLTDPASPLSKRSVFFDFDGFVIKDEFKSLIQAHAQYLKQNAKAKVILQGGVAKGQAEPAIVTVTRVHGTQLGAGTFEGEDAWNVLMGLATVVKSWDNVQTARLWEAYKAIMSEKGERLDDIDPEGEDRMLIFLKKMGIDSHERYAAAKLRQWNMKNNPEKEVKKALDSATSLLMYYITNGDLQDPDTAKKWSQEMHYLRESLASEEDKEKFARMWSERVMDESTLLGKEWKKYLGLRIEYEKNVLAAPPLESVFVKDRLPENRNP